MAADGSGNIYVADSDNNTIRTGNPLPVITSPLSAVAVLGQKFVYQLETLLATSLGATNLPPGLAFDSSLSAIVGTPTSNGTFQVGLSASNASGTTSATLRLVVQTTPPSGPVIVSSTSATGRTGQPFQFQVLTTGASPAAQLSVTDCPCGLTADPLSGLISGTPVADGSTKVSLTVTDVNATATGAVQLTFTSDPVRPVITSSDRANPGFLGEHSTTKSSRLSPIHPILRRSVSSELFHQDYPSTPKRQPFREYLTVTPPGSDHRTRRNLPVAFSERSSSSAQILTGLRHISFFSW